jgi:hypothetical protein
MIFKIMVKILTRRFCCGRNNPPLLFLLQAKGKGPPTKILSLFPNPLLLEPNVISLPTLRELRFGLD